MHKQYLNNEERDRSPFSNKIGNFYNVLFANGMEKICRPGVKEIMLMIKLDYFLNSHYLFGMFLYFIYCITLEFISVFVSCK